MKYRNIYEADGEDLERHDDERGMIADIFYNKNINHVAVVKTHGPAVRGNHYHKNTTQHILMTSGTMRYWWRHIDSDEWHCFDVLPGNLITTPPNEVHTLVYTEPGEFVVFSEGKRGGKDYESDTFRVEPLDV